MGSSDDDDDDDSDNEGQACSQYRIDMTASEFGTCMCGRPKSEHKMTTKAGANARKIVGGIGGAVWIGPATPPPTAIPSP